MQYQTKYLKARQYWNDWKFQIHWNKMEWAVPKSRNVKKTPFCTYFHKFYIKDKLLKTIGLYIQSLNLLVLMNY